MKPGHSILPFPSRQCPAERGSLLITALLFALGLAIVLGSYLTLGRTALKLAQRTSFANDTTNLAEAGLEQALYCFNMMGAGAAAATAWAGWTISGANAMYTLPTFNRDQNAIGIVKVYVTGYDGTNATPSILSQAVITPFDGGAPVVKTVRLALRANLPVTSVYGVVALEGLDLNVSSFADSFNSNPSNSPTGPWAVYSSAVARANTTVVVLQYNLNIGGGQVAGNVLLGAGVSPPMASKVTGTITTGFTGTFPMPVYPTAAAVSKSYTKGATLPATLPISGDLAASDGRYYYFCSGATIGPLTISAGKKVTIVGTNNTSMIGGLVVNSLASCLVYIDGTLTVAAGKAINGTNWAGALTVYTTTTGACSFADNSIFTGIFYAPSCTLQATGTSSGSRLTGSFVARTISTSGAKGYHFDEALGTTVASPGNPWKPTGWLELQSAADRATVAGLTGNYLR